MLHAIRAKQDEHDRKFDKVITRLGALERDFAGMKMDFAGITFVLTTFRSASIASSAGWN